MRPLSLLINLLAGAMFGFGLALSGMTQPEKVLGFLDVSGAWDPALLFVLGGAVGVTVFAFRLVLRQQQPVLCERFELPVNTQVDAPLLVGAAMFGAGWGIGGYCPGPAVALLGAGGNHEAWIFLPAMLLGQWLYHGVAKTR
jgi:uncharacterized protein